MKHTKQPCGYWAWSPGIVWKSQNFLAWSSSPHHRSIRENWRVWAPLWQFYGLLFCHCLLKPPPRSPPGLTFTLIYRFPPAVRPTLPVRTLLALISELFKYCLHTFCPLFTRCLSVFAHYCALLRSLRTSSPSFVWLVGRWEDYLARKMLFIDVVNYKHIPFRSQGICPIFALYLLISNRMLIL